MSRLAPDGLSVRRACAVALTVAFALLLGACGPQGTAERPTDPWPPELDVIHQSRYVSSAAGVAIGGRSLVVGDDGIWEYAGPGFVRRAMFASGHSIIWKRVDGERRLGGVSGIGSHVFITKRVESGRSDGEGVVEMVDAVRLFSLDALNPADKEAVTVLDHMAGMRAYESPDLKTQLLVIERGQYEKLEISLLARRAGRWREVWSTSSAGASASIEPRCYGFVTDPATDEVYLSVIGSDNGSTDSLRAMRVSAQGAVEPVALSHEAERVIQRQRFPTYLGDHVRQGAQGYCYAVASGSRSSGVVLVEGGGVKIRGIDTARRPVATVTDPAGRLGIVLSTFDRQLHSLELVDADTAERITMAPAGWAVNHAIEIRPIDEWPTGIAVIDDGDLDAAGSAVQKSVHVLRADSIRGPWTRTRVLDWRVPSAPYNDISSVDDLVLPDGQALVLGMRLGYEAAIGVVRIPE